ncbi:MAG: hypothetical protein ACNA7Q_05800 [Rhodobacterales bacterium]
MARKMTPLRNICLKFVSAAALILALPAMAVADQFSQPRAPQADMILPAAANCPPGLAKKNPPCVPPGQARKSGGDHYRIGDKVPDGFIILRSPSRYGLDPRYTYYERNGYVVHVDQESRKILNLIGAVADLLQ